MKTVNGSITLAQNVNVEGDLESVNGSAECGAGSEVHGDVVTVNGSIRLAGTTVEGEVRTYNGRVVLSEGSRIKRDLVIERSSGSVRDVRVFPPQPLCQWQEPASGECAWPGADTDNVVPANYEGNPLTPDPAVVAIAERATAVAADLKNESLGVVLAVMP